MYFMLQDWHYQLCMPIWKISRYLIRFILKVGNKQSRGTIDVTNTIFMNCWNMKKKKKISKMFQHTIYMLWEKTQWEHSGKKNFITLSCLNLTIYIGIIICTIIPSTFDNPWCTTLFFCYFNDLQWRHFSRCAMT